MCPSSLVLSTNGFGLRCQGWEGEEPEMEGFPEKNHPTQEAVQKICRHHLQRPSGLGKTNGTVLSRPHPSKPLAPAAFAMRRMTDSANPLGTADSAAPCGLDIHRRMRRLVEPWKQRALFGRHLSSVSAASGSNTRDVMLLPVNCFYELFFFVCARSATIE